jgi:alkylation response protein AidB-like acyl-CoA dehydrogenase
MNTTLTPSGDGHILHGKKYYVTGSMYCDWVRVHASNPDGGTVICVVPTDRAGVILNDDWDGIGQRFTGSGTGIFDQVAVPEADVLHTASAFAASDKPSEDDPEALAIDAYIVGQQVQLILTAIIAGIMRNIAADAAEHLRGRSRTYSHASAETGPQDPLLQDIVGRIASLAMAAESVILAAGDALDAAAASVASGTPELDVVHQGSIIAAQAKVVIDEMAPRAATMLFDIGGSSAVKQSANLDRHWRNARTLASHNPTPYKARAVGDYLLNGTLLPTNGFF